MRRLLAALVFAAPLVLVGCSSGEVQSSDVEAYKKAGLPAGEKASAEEQRPER